MVSTWSATVAVVILVLIVVVLLWVVWKTDGGSAIRDFLDSD